MVSSKRALADDLPSPSPKKAKFDATGEGEVAPPGDKHYGSSNNGHVTGMGKKEAPSGNGKARREGVKVGTKAEILSLATGVHPGERPAKENLSEREKDIMQKIKKALSLGTHEQTGEAEKNAAMRLARKLMAKHNVDQADVLNSEDDAQKLQRAGQSTVTIRSLTGSRVLLHSWSSTLASAMDEFFDCKSYSEAFDDRLDWTYYGLAEQTVAAAYAYEMVYNLILMWSAQNKAAKGRSEKNNYCHGLADGTYELAVQERKEEERLAIKKAKEQLVLTARAEEEQRARELARLKGPDASQEPKLKVEPGTEEEEEKKIKIELIKKEEDEKKRFKVEIETEEENETKIKVEDAGDEECCRMIDDNLDGPSLQSSTGERNDGDGSDDGGDHDLGDQDVFQADFNAQDGDLDAMLTDFDATGRINVTLDRLPIPVQRPEEESMPLNIEAGETPWASPNQLTLFRKNALSIADEYLKKSEIKLVKASKTSGPNMRKGGRQAYIQGLEDAKKIDVKRKRIKDAGQD